MWKTISSFVAATLLSVSVAQSDEPYLTPFNEQMVGQLQSTFNYQSTWGLTARHDLQDTSGTGSIDLEGGYISLETGSTAGGTAELTTVEYGRYFPGRGAVAGVGFLPVEIPTGDGVIQWGAFTDSDGAYFRIKNNQLCVVYENNTSEAETCGYRNFNGNPKPDDFDPLTDASIANIRLNWYGVGGAEYILYYADADSPSTVEKWLVHRFVPARGQAFQDPNLPIRVSVDNGTANENIEVQVGGRRYDTEGSNQAEGRLSGEYASGQTIASGNDLQTMMCMRRKLTFPGDTRENTVSVKVLEFDVSSTESLAVWLVVDPDLSSPTWSDPSEHQSDETAVESYVSVDTITTYDTVSGPYLVTTTGTFLDPVGNISPSIDLEFPSNDPVCLVARNLAGQDATVTSAIRVLEFW